MALCCSQKLDLKRGIDTGNAKQQIKLKLKSLSSHIKIYKAQIWYNTPLPNVIRSVASWKSTLNQPLIWRLFFATNINTGQSIASIGKIPIEILPEKRPITWVLAVLLFLAEFQMEPLGPNVIFHYTSQEAVLDKICTSK